jgi:preprotein translocase subunit SecB
MTDQESQAAAAPVFNIEKIYIRDLSVEVPNAPAIFLEREAPQIDLNLNTTSTKIDEGIYQTIISLVVNAKVNGKVAFLVELHQAGIFRIQNLPEEAMGPALGVGCPNILFPYAREVVSEAVMKAGFPPLLMQPVNFEMLYLQQQQAQNQQAN